MSVNSKMTAIADAIRAKTGKQDLLSLDAMATEIESIETDSTNFEIVGGTTEPTNPEENTIWVNTDTEITSYVFSSTEPTEPIDGMVWIKTGMESAGEFNLLKNNCIQIYPISAKQYSSNEWIDIEAKNYVENEWVNWWNGELYVNGNQYESITGGWWNNTNLSFYGSSAYPGKIVDLDTCLGEYISIEGTAGYFASVSTKEKINLNEYSLLLYDIQNGSATDEPIVFIHSELTGRINRIAVASSSSGNIDISALTDSYYITVGALNSRKVYIGNIRLE